MVNLNITIPDGFLEAEERDGYYVTKQMKAVWAVELDLLVEAMRVLDKYSIKYFAIGGTLLGAIRHKGYIPWDDDIDIAIPRKDYERFRKIAYKEFSHPYFYQDEFNSPGLLCGHAKLRNSETTMITSNHLDEKVGKLSFNMGIFIDFFPVDNLPDDSVELDKWLTELKKIAKKAWHLRIFTHRGRVIGDRGFKYRVQQCWLESILNKPNLFFHKYNRLLAKYSTTDTKESCLYCVYCREHTGNHKFLWNNSDLDVHSLITYPFEFLEIPCPSNYDHILKTSYGNWHIKVQAKSQHGFSTHSFYDVDKSYLNYFDESGYLDRKLVNNILENKNNSISKL